MEQDSQTRSVTASAGIISLCVAVSRVTGFARTWAMAFALGATFLSSSYQVANNLPNQLYELVMGGMLVTAFLPVYVSTKKKLGTDAGNDYASSLFNITVLLLGIVSLIGILFPQAIVYTQTFMSDQADMATAVMLFQFFAIQTVFYGASSIFSGLLNANREYFWSSIAPVFNNLMVIATFIAYAIVAPTNPTLALYVIAIGNPLGVFAQMCIQIPALRRNGIKLTLHINWKDPALKETLKIGAPAILVMVMSFVTVSVMNAASYCFADNGPSVIAYARLWYTLPYSFLAIPITTTMFTELSEMHAAGDMKGVMEGIASGTAQIMFLLVPFAVFLIVFAEPLVTLYHTGAFTSDRIGQIAGFLAALALALPFYGTSAYMQKAFSSLRRMGTFALFSLVASIVQVVLTMAFAIGATQGAPFPIETIAWSSAVFYIALDGLCLVYLSRNFGRISPMAIAKPASLGLALGLLGGLLGGAVSLAIQQALPGISQTILQAAICVVAGGIVSVAVTFGVALKLDIPEAALARTFVDGAKRKLRRK